MPTPYELHLSAEEQVTLEEARDHHPSAYVRERASALLKIAYGRSGRWVAQHGLLRPHSSDTVFRWVHRYQEGGIAALKVSEGRGRKPAFFPSAPE